jgi:hypothetical protein
MERQTFRYGGLGINDALDASLGVNAYIGMVQGLKSTEHLGDVYLGIAVTYQVGISGGQGISVGSGGSRFWSVTDPRLRGITGYIGGGYSDDLLPIVDLDVSVLAYGAINRPVPYALQGKVDRTRLLNDIRSGKGSQLNLLGNVMLPARTVATIFATLSANTYEALWSENDKY